MTKIALVTGGTRGIGKAISLSLKDAGYTVVANYAGNDEAAKAFTGDYAVDSVSAEETAAWIATLRVVLNLDEFLTRS